MTSAILRTEGTQLNPSLIEDVDVCMHCLSLNPRQETKRKGNRDEGGRKRAQQKEQKGASQTGHSRVV